MTEFPAYGICREQRQILLRKQFQPKLSLGNEEVLDLLSSFSVRRQLMRRMSLIFWLKLTIKSSFKNQIKICFWLLGRHLETLENVFPNSRSIVTVFITAANTCKDLLYVDFYTRNQSLAHLKRWVKGLDDSSLLKFLRLSTGADVVIGNCIQVTFISITGASRSPIFHTCGSELELPSTY